MITTVSGAIWRRDGMMVNPSTAEVTVIGGVIMPSAIIAAPPIIAGMTSHFRRRRTRAYKAKVPPSPRLSALKISTTYLIVVCRVRVQMMQDKDPMNNSSLISRFPIISLNTYKGEVPMSPYIIPSAISSPAAVTLFVETFTC